MEKRFSERVYSNIKIDFYYDNGIYEATAKNLSKNGMYINTEKCPPSESDIVVSLNQGHNFFTLPGKVKRTVNANNLCGIGIELQNPSQSYYEFVSDFMNKYLPYRLKNWLISLIKRSFPA